MARQPEDVQVFLRRTSILERFCAPLCEAVVGGEVIGEKGIIDYLDRSNLFLIPLDDRREWYRYHHLFADFLGQRLSDKEPERIPELHRRASQWYEAEELVDEAIQHALAAGDMGGATRLVDKIAADLVVRRESNKLLKLVQQLPTDQCQDFPVLCIWHAWALLFLGQLEAVEPVLKIAEINQDKVPEIPINGYSTTVRSYLANQLGEIHKALALSEQALDMMLDAPPERITLIFRGAVVIWLGVNHRSLGNLDQARQLFKEAAALNQEVGNIYAALASYEQLAELAVIRGELHQAQNIYQSGLKVAQNWLEENSNSRGALLAAGGLHLGLGTVLYQKNDLVGATPHLQRGVELFDLGEVWGRTHSYRMLAYLKQAEGDLDASFELLSKAWAIKGTTSVRQSNTSDLPSLNQLGILLSRIRPEMAYLLKHASRRVEKLGAQANDKVDFSSPADYPRELIYSDLAHLLIALDRAAEALPMLTCLLEAAHSMGRHGDEIRYLALIALAHHAIEGMPSALESLQQALFLAESQSYMRIFVDEGQPMAELLQMAILQDITPIYASNLLAAFPEDVRSAVEMNIVTVTQPLVEPLSQREIEVLCLIAAGCKYQEIAEQLVISLNTVRHHTRNVYSKLNVNNRARAIDRAKELDLF